MTDRENTIDILRRGYDEPTRSLSFRVGFYGDWPAVFECLLRIDSYNAFDAERVIDALEPFAADNIALKVEVGRESSPVMYFTGGPPHLDAIADAMLATRADELDTNGDTLRVWWD